MKTSNFFTKNNFSKIGIISIILSFIFFLASIFYISFSDYTLANYKQELKDKFAIDYDIFFNFDYVFASNTLSTYKSTNIAQIEKLVVQAPKTEISAYTYPSDDFDMPNQLEIDYSSRKLNSLSLNNILDYKYLSNTKTAIITINDSLDGIHYSNLYLRIPSTFKGELVIQSFEDNVSSDYENLKIEAPTVAN